jgi:hypothetical protein
VQNAGWGEEDRKRGDKPRACEVSKRRKNVMECQ